MQHHINTHGHLYSSTDQNEGSKKLWKDFISNNHSNNYKSVSGEHETSLDKSDLDKLWSKDSKSIQAKTKIKVIKNESN